MTNPGPYNPLDGVMLAQASRPPVLEALDLQALSPFQRALLVLDGTVTKFIEAYTLEPLEIIRLAQDQHKLSHADPWLEVPQDTTGAKCSGAGGNICRSCRSRLVKFATGTLSAVLTGLSPTANRLH